MDQNRNLWWNNLFLANDIPLGGTDYWVLFYKWTIFFQWHTDHFLQPSLTQPLLSSVFLYDNGELGNLSLTGFNVDITRHYYKYLIVYYLPSGLFVVVSWTSFIIPPQVCTNWTAVSWQLSVMSCLWKTKAQSNIGKTCNTCNIILGWVSVNSSAVQGLSKLWLESNCVWDGK